MKHVDLQNPAPPPSPASLPPLVKISEVDGVHCVVSLRVSFADAYKLSQAIAAHAGELMALWEGSGCLAETYHVADARRLAHLAEELRLAQAEFMGSGKDEVTR